MQLFMVIINEWKGVCTSDPVENHGITVPTQPNRGRLLSGVHGAEGCDVGYTGWCFACCVWCCPSWPPATLTIPEKTKAMSLLWLGKRSARSDAVTLQTELPSIPLIIRAREKRV